MSAKANTFKIGIFAIVAVVLFVLGLLAFGARSYFAPKTRFETAVEGDVAGLSVGSGVQLRGVPIGKVTKITFSWHDYPQTKTHLLIVEFEIDGDLMPWPSGSVGELVKNSVDRGLRAVVKGQGITGTSILSLDTVDPPPKVPELDYTPHYYYIPSTAGQFTRMLEAIENSLENVQKLDFAGIGQGVTNALGSVRQLSEKIDKLDLQAISTNANNLLVDIKGAVNKVQDTVAQAQETLKGMKLDTVTTNANGLVSDLRDTNERLQTLLAKINTVPMHETVADLEQTLQTLNDVLLELKQYPAGFFLGEPPLPVPGVPQARQAK